MTEWQIVVCFEDANWFFSLFIYCVCVCLSVFSCQTWNHWGWAFMTYTVANKRGWGRRRTLTFRKHLCFLSFYTVHCLYSIYNCMLFTHIHEEKQTETRLKPRTDGPYRGLKTWRPNVAITSLNTKRRNSCTQVINPTSRALNTTGSDLEPTAISPSLLKTSGSKNSY